MELLAEKPVTACRLDGAVPFASPTPYSLRSDLGVLNRPSGWPLDEAVATRTGGAGRRTVGATRSTWGATEAGSE